MCLERVEVDCQERERLCGIGSGGDRNAEVVLEGAAVSEPRQRVGPCLRGELIDAPL